MTKKTEKEPLLMVHSDIKGNIFYSAKSLQPLLETLRKVGCKSDIMVYSDELMEHIKNIKARGDEL